MKTIKTITWSVSVFLLMITGTIFGQVLDVPEVIQEQSQWCWAAVSKNVLSYYGHDNEQCEIAEYTRTVATWHDFGQVNCCENPNLGCNYWNYNWGYTGSIADILNHFSGIETNNIGSKLTLAQIENELINGKPFIFRWGFTSGGGHFLVGHGLTGNAMHYMDPWFGQGHMIADYDWVVSSQTHSWTHTQKMNLPFVIEASAHENGHIFPEGSFGVTYGGRQSFLVTPDDNYKVDYIMVDDLVVDLANDPGWNADSDTYTFLNIDQNHTISVWFKESETGLQESAQGNIRVYPNPVRNKISIVPDDTGIVISALTLIDITGKTIKTKTFNSSNQFDYGMDVSALDHGVYLLKIQLVDSLNQYHKIIKTQ